MRNRATALLGQIETALGASRHLAGDAFTIATSRPSGTRGGCGAPASTCPASPNILRWMEAIESRPAVAKALSL